MPGLGLGSSVRKETELQDHLHLAGALLGSRLGAELPAHREAEFQPLSKTPWINSSVQSRARQGHKKEAVLLLLKILSFLPATIAIFCLLYVTGLKLMILILFIFKSDSKVVFCHASKRFYHSSF